MITYDEFNSTLFNYLETKLVLLEINAATIQACRKSLSRESEFVIV